jgi:hypothetical protein
LISDTENGFYAVGALGQRFALSISLEISPAALAFGFVRILGQVPQQFKEVVGLADETQT